MGLRLSADFCQILWSLALWRPCARSASAIFLPSACRSSADAQALPDFFMLSRCCSKVVK